jgi:hypothetical protein
VIRVDKRRYLGLVWDKRRASIGIHPSFISMLDREWISKFEYRIHGNCILSWHSGESSGASKLTKTKAVSGRWSREA